MATQTQKENQLKALAKKGLQDGLSKDEIVTKLQPVADQKVAAPEKIVETPKTSVDPKGVDAIGVPQSVAEEAKTAGNAEKPQEQASQGEIQPVPDAQSMVAPQGTENTQTETVETPEVVQNMPVMLNMQTSSPIEIARGVKNGQIKLTDFNNLAQTNPELYQLALIEKQKQDIQDGVNQSGADYLQAVQNINKQFEAQAVNMGGTNAVEEFKAFMPKNRYADQLLSIANQIAEIDNARDTLLEDTERETGNADLSYNLAKANEKDGLLLKQRRLLVSEHGALQSQYEMEYNQALQQYDIYRQAEDKKMEFQAGVLQRQYGLTLDAYNMGVAQAERDLTALEQERATIRETQAARAEAQAAQMEFERDVMLEDMRRQRDVALEDTRWERDKTYEMQLREMDFDDKVALMGLDVNIQAAILDNKLRLESEWGVNTKTFEDDDGNIVAFDPATNKSQVVYKPSDTNTLDFIKAQEGFRSEAYQDSAGVRTIGYGTTRINGKPVTQGMTISEENATKLFQEQVAGYQNWRNFVNVPLTKEQETALTSFEYNLGSGIWEKDAMPIINGINSNDIEQAQSHLMKYVNAGGQFVKGLQNRREREAAMLVPDTKLTDKEFTQANQVINSFKSEPQVKVFEDAYSQSLSLLSSINDESGPGDVAAIFSFMKSLDPQSVVRESEFELAAKSAGVTEYWKTTYQRVKDGDKLSPKQREAFGALAKQFILDKATIYDTKYNDYIRRLEMQGINTAVFPTSIADQMREQLGVSNTQDTKAPSWADTYKQSVTGGVVNAQGISVNSEDILNTALQLN